MHVCSNDHYRTSFIGLRNRYDLGGFRRPMSSRKNTYEKHNQNILKGAELENPVHNIYKQSGWNVEEHKVTDNGVDSKASKNRKLRVAECLHWYGGYIHVDRWLSITNNLLSCPSADKDLICVGVHPTEEQYEDAHNLNINIIYGDTVAEATTKLKNLINGVITLEPESNDMISETALMSSYPFSSYADLELDYWNVIYSDLFS